MRDGMTMKAPSVNRAVAETGTWVLSVGVLAFLVLIGTQSPLLAIAAIGLAGILVMILCLDLAVAGAAFVTFAMFLAPMNDVRLGNSYVTASDVMFVLGFTILVPVVIGNRIKIPLLFLLGVSILLVMGAVSSAASPIPFVSAGQVARLTVGAFLLPIFLMVWRPRQHLIVRFAGAYIFGNVVSVGWGLLQGPVPGDPRYVGLTYHPNYLGLACLLGASLTPYVVAKVQPERRWIFWGASVVCAYGVWISGSRAALLVLIMLAVIYPFVERSVAAVGAILLGVLGVLVFSGRLLQEDGNNALGRLFGGGSASGSDLDRKNKLATALEQLRKHPIVGNGFDGGIGAHNIYLQVAVAVGLIGLIGYLMILWTALRPLFWQDKSHRIAYPVLAYAAIGPLTNTLWERLIWAVVALSFAVAVRSPDPDDVDGVVDAREPLPELKGIHG